MARITVEDCLEKIPNRFQLVLAATYRARMQSQGHAPRIESRNKPAVTALRKFQVDFCRAMPPNEHRYAVLFFASLPALPLPRYI